MDIGVGRFLEKFEEYFGRKAMGVLLFLIFLAVTSVCLRLIYNFVDPIVSFARQNDWAGFGEYLRESLIPIVIGVLVLGLAVHILTLTASLIYKKFGRQREHKKIVAKITKEAKIEADRYIVEAENKLKSIERDVESVTDEHLKKLQDITSNHTKHLDEYEAIEGELRSIASATREICSSMIMALEQAESEVALGTLKQALRDNDLESFIKEHEDDDPGDLDKVEAVIKRSDQETGSSTRQTSSEASSDD